MIKIKILNPTKGRNEPTFRPFGFIKDILRDYSIQFTNSDDFDYLFVCQFPYIYIVPWKNLKALSCFTFSMYESYRHDLTDERTYINKVILEKEGKDERIIN